MNTTQLFQEQSLDADISKATSEVDKAIDKLDLPKGVTVGVAGVAADMTETFTQLDCSHACSNRNRVLHPCCHIP